MLSPKLVSGYDWYNWHLACNEWLDVLCSAHATERETRWYFQRDYDPALAAGQIKAMRMEGLELRAVR